MISSSSRSISGIGGGSSSMSFGSSRKVTGLIFSLTVIHIRNSSNQILNCHGGSKFTAAQNLVCPFQCDCSELRILLAAPFDILQN